MQDADIPVDLSYRHKARSGDIIAENIRSLAFNAAKVNQRAQRLFTDLLTTTGRENARLHNERLDFAITYKVEWEKLLARRERHGITGLPDPTTIPTTSSFTSATTVSASRAR
ncbi:MAG: hypothetical protein WAU86_21940 [Oricola sp.]